MSAATIQPAALSGPSVESSWHLRQLIRIGVIGGGIAIYLCLVGIVPVFAERPLIVPEGAVVVPGARAVTAGKGPEWKLSLATPVIVKYRDSRTDTRTELEAWIREST